MFFSERLNNNWRLQMFYGEGAIKLPFHGSLSLSELLSIPLVINASYYPPIHNICETAVKHLRHHDGDIAILGLGDGHGGNVMVPKPFLNSHSQLLYVDYEAAGCHSPWLDMAKPLYNDIFFEIFYADLLNVDLFVSGVVSVQLKDGLLYINLSLPQSHVTKGLWEIKRRFILEPLIASLPLAFTVDWERRLGHALFCCALQTRNYHCRPDMFLPIWQLVCC